MRTSSITILLFMLCLFVTSVMALPPNTVSYQGRLTDNAGDPVADGVHSVTFSIYSSGVGGSLLWVETLNVTTANGLFSTILGEINPLFTNIFTAPGRFLGIKVESDPEMTPRTPLTSVPFALQSANSSALNNELADYYLDWNNMNNIPSGFADGIDNEGSSAWGDLTGVPAGFADGIDNEGSGGTPNGIASHQQFLVKTLNNSTMTDISTVTITIPDSGYIFVTGRCSIGFSGTTQNNIATVQIDETAGGYSNNSALTVGLYGYSNTIEGYMPVTVDKVYHKTSAGTYTFRLEGIGGSTDISGVCKAYYQGITAMYFPVAMGTVD